MRKAKPGQLTQPMPASLSLQTNNWSATKKKMAPVLHLGAPSTSGVQPAPIQGSEALPSAPTVDDEVEIIFLSYKPPGESEAYVAGPPLEGVLRWTFTIKAEKLDAGYGNNIPKFHLPPPPPRAIGPI